VTAVNAERVLQANMASSALLNGGRIPLIIERRHIRTGAVCNAGLSRTNAEVIISPYQDMYLHLDGDIRLISVRSSIEKSHSEFSDPFCKEKKL